MTQTFLGHTLTKPNADLDALWAAVAGANVNSALPSGLTITTLAAYLLNNRVFNVLDYGALGDGATDDAAAFQLTRTKLVAAGGGTFLTPGARTYVVGCPSTTTYAGGTIHYTVLLTSNMILDLQGSTIKVKNSTTTNASPIATSVFFSNVPLANIQLTGNGTIDLNGANNGVNSANLLQAALVFSSDGAYCNDLLIENTQFLNTCGTNYISFSQTNTVGAAIGSRNAVKNCRFLTTTPQLTVTDHSSISGAVNDAWVKDCTFEFTTVRGDNIGVAWDLQGTNNFFVHNKVKNYFCGPQIGGNYVSPSSDIVISDNVMTSMKGYGVNFFREVATEQVIDWVTIDNNVIELEDTFTNLDMKSAVRFITQYGITNLHITNNKVRKTGTTKECIAFYGGPALAGQTYSGITIRGNQVDGCFTGVKFIASTGNIGTVVVSDNTFRNIRLMAAQITSIGVQFFSSPGLSIANATIKNNEFVNDAGGTFSYGVYLSGTIGTLNYRGNDYQGITTQNYLETGLAITTRNGNFDGLPYTPTWYCGGGQPITLGNGSITGSYDIRDKQVTVRAQLTIGSTTVCPSGTFLFSLPLTSTLFGVDFVGTSRIYRSSGPVSFIGVPEIDGTASIATFMFRDGAVAANNLAPVTPTNGDVYTAQITYSIP